MTAETNVASAFEGLTLRSLVTNNSRPENEGLIALTGPQKNRLQSLVLDPPYAPDFAHTGEINPNLRVFVAHFDGTWNDKDKVPEGESKTIVGLLYEESLRQKNPAVETHYLHGVGTRTSLKSRVLYEGVTGNGCESRAEQMHERLLIAARRWQAENPNVEIHVHAVGFSRGAATALHFLNLVDERGARSPNHKGSENLAAGKVKSSAALLDVVATGQEKVLKLTVPPTAQAVLHLTAGGEERRHFKVTTLGDRRYDPSGKATNLLDNPEWAEAKGVSAPPYVCSGPAAIRGAQPSFIYQRIQQISLPGTRHSDVGGGYVEKGVAGVPMFLVNGFQKSLGLPGAEPVRPTIKEIQGAMAHDSRDKIEITRQSLETLFGKKFDAHKVERQIAKEQERPWNGDLLRNVQINLLNEEGQQIDYKQFRMVIPHKEGAPKPTLKELAATQAFCYDPNEVLKDPSSHPFLNKKNEHFKMEEHPGMQEKNQKRLIFKGVQIDDGKDLDSLFKEFVDHGLQKKLQLAVVVDDERLFCPLQEGNQKVLPGSVLLMRTQQDPWPEGIQNSIRTLNERTHVDLNHKYQPSRLSHGEARQLLSSAMEDAALAMGIDFPEVSKVNFKVGKDERDPKKNSVHVTAYGDDATALMSNRKKAEGAEEGNMRHRLKELSEGIDCIVKMLQTSGYHMEGYEVKMTAQAATATPPMEAQNEMVVNAVIGDENQRARRAPRPGTR